MKLAKGVRNLAVMRKIFQALGPDQQLKGGAESCMAQDVLVMRDGAGKEIYGFTVCGGIELKKNHPATVFDHKKNLVWKVVVPDGAVLAELLKKHLPGYPQTKATNTPQTKPTNPTQTKAADPIKAKAADPIKAKAADPTKAKAADPIKAKAADPIKAKAADPIKAKAADPIKAPQPE